MLDLVVALEVGAVLALGERVGSAVDAAVCLLEGAREHLDLLVRGPGSHVRGLRGAEVAGLDLGLQILDLRLHLLGQRLQVKHACPEQRGKCRVALDLSARARVLRLGNRGRAGGLGVVIREGDVQLRGDIVDGGVERIGCLLDVVPLLEARFAVKLVGFPVGNVGVEPLRGSVARVERGFHGRPGLRLHKILEGRDHAANALEVVREDHVGEVRVGLLLGANFLGRDLFRQASRVAQNDGRVVGVGPCDPVRVEEVLVLELGIQVASRLLELLGEPLGRCSNPVAVHEGFDAVEALEVLPRRAEVIGGDPIRALAELKGVGPAVDVTVDVAESPSGDLDAFVEGPRLRVGRLGCLEVAGADSRVQGVDHP